MEGSCLSSSKVKSILSYQPEYSPFRSGFNQQMFLIRGYIWSHIYNQVYLRYNITPETTPLDIKKLRENGCYGMLQVRHFELPKQFFKPTCLPGS